jgi:large-conductance mechanosensitive channel
MSKIIEKEIEEYKKFAFNKNLIEVGAGVILATSFQKAVAGISNHLIMPFVGYFLTTEDKIWKNAKLNLDKNLTLEIGQLTEIILEFLLTTIILYIIYKKIACHFWIIDNPEMESTNEK